MPSKKSVDMVFLKDLGSLQKKVLFFLAENPDNHKQAIQQGIKYPAEQYGSVLNAANTLEKLGCIKSKEAVSEKKLKIKTYSCTDTGVFIALGKNPDADFVRILDAYKDRSEIFKAYRDIYDIWGRDTFARYFRNAIDFFPMMQKEGIERAMSFMLIKSMMDAQALDPKARKRNAKAAMKRFPNAKRIVKEWTDNLKDVL